MFQARLKYVLWVAIGVGIVVRLLIPWLSLSFLLEYVVSDDAFYYFTITRHVMAGRGVTFDGVTPTNGFHPLWLLCLLPIYGIAGADAVLALRLSLALGATFSVGAVLLLGAAVGGWMENDVAGYLASALLALNLYAILEAVNGLETSLALFMLSVTLAVLERWRDRGDGPSSLRAFSRRGLLFGVVGGALIWARSDMALVLAGLYAYLLIARKASFWELVVSGSVTATMVAAWLAWSWATVGTPVQSSAIAIPWLVRARMNDAIAEGRMTQAQVVARMWQHFTQTTMYQMLNYAGIGLLAGLIALIVDIVRRRRCGSSAMHLYSVPPGWLWWGAMGTLAMLLLSEFVRFSLREWYIAPIALWSSVFGAGLLAGWVTVPRMWRMLTLVCLGVILVAGGQAGRDLGRRGRYWFQLDQLAAARWIAANVPTGDVVGSWTAGIYGYFSQRRVVNLDGVVNWNAVHAYQARRLYAYMDEQDIRWLVDFDQFVADFMNFYGADPLVFLSPVQVFEQTESPFGRLVVYEVKP